MKNILFLLFFFSIVTFSQKKSTNNLHISNANKDLLIIIKNFNLKRLSRINLFFSKNPSYKLKNLENGELISEVYDIIDDKPIYLSINNVNSAIVTRTNFLQTGGNLGLNLNGENMYLGIWDGSPVRATHQEFIDDNSNSRVSNPDQSASNPEGNHATHVAGTLIARGVVSNAKGMAPKATLVSYDWDFDNEEVLNEASNNNLLISNHSYGIPVLNLSGTLNAPVWMMGNYNSDAKIWDDIAYTNPYYLMVAAAGNDGNSSYDGGLAPNFDKLTGNKNSKNNLVVANANNPLINPNGSGELLNLFINSSSSQGPSDDGRVKPDITADGTNVYSCSKSSDQAYQTLTGTSMASPNVAGSILLLQQYYNELFSTFMRAATLKGLVCHTADDDFSSPGPDPIFGWGLLNVKKAAELITNKSDNISLIQEKELNNSDIFEYTFNCSGGDNLIATICWTDPSGVSRNGQVNSTVPALVNDLDLRIVNINTGDIFYPWKLNLSNVQGHAIKGDNLVDNVEKVEINFPDAGIYKVRVSHKGTLENSNQKYSLILSGDAITLDSDTFTLEPNISIFPNPFVNFISIKSEVLIKKVILYNFLGESILTKEYQDDNLNLNLKNLEKGSYFIQVFTSKNNHIFKIIK